MFVGPNYPADAPQIRFKEPKVAMDAVGADGKVNLARLAPGFQWRSSMNIADALMAVRENMKNKQVCQASGQLGGTRYF